MSLSVLFCVYLALFYFYFDHEWMCLELFFIFFRSFLCCFL